MPTRKIHIAILSAMREELDYLNEIFAQCKVEIICLNEFEFKLFHYQKTNILVVHTGLGTAFAASALTLIHCMFHPDYVFVSGSAGAIAKELNIGDVIIAESAFEAEIQDVFPLVKNTPFEGCLQHPFKKQFFPSSYQADQELLEIANSIDPAGRNVVTGKVVTSNCFPAPLELFNKIKAQQPLSIDMETSAFYQIAWLLNIKTIAIRGISNKLNQDGTDDHVGESDLHGASLAAAKLMLEMIDKLIARKYQVTVTKTAECHEVTQLIERLNLQPHPEGGLYAQLYKSEEQVVAAHNGKYHGEVRAAGTSIYYLLAGKDFSAWHRLQSDEIWHFYQGSALKLYVLDELGNLSPYVLGNPLSDVNANYQIVIPANHWFAAEVIDKFSYTLLGCTVSPGFEFKDFELADRNDLLSTFPQHEKMICELSR